MSEAFNGTDEGQLPNVSMGELDSDTQDYVRGRLERIPNINALGRIGEGLQIDESRTVLRLPDNRAMHFKMSDTFSATAGEVAELLENPQPIDPRWMPYAVVSGKPNEDGLPPTDFPPEVTGRFNPDANVGYVSATRTEQGVELRVGCFEPTTRTLYELPLSSPHTDFSRWR